MSGFFRSRAGRRSCLLLLFAALPVTIFAAAAQGAAAVAPLSTNDSAFNYFGTTIFALAVIHTFLAAKFMKLAHKFEQEHREELLRRGDAADIAEAASRFTQQLTALEAAQQVTLRIQGLSLFAKL